MRCLVSLAMLMAAVVVSPAVAADVAEVRRTLLEMDRKFAAEAAKRGVDGFADWMAETGILKFEGPGTEPLTSREQVRAAMKKSQGDRPFTLKWEPLHADAAASGELGYTSGRWTSSGKDKNGAPVTRTGHYVTIWKRQTNGSWKVVVDVGN